jgi:uncharacterized membrane protein
VKPRVLPVCYLQKIYHLTIKIPEYFNGIEKKLTPWCGFRLEELIFNQLLLTVPNFMEPEGLL